MPRQREKIEVYEGQMLESAILSEDGGTILCKSGTIMTPELIRRLGNWVVKVEKGRKQEETEDPVATFARIDRERILRRLDFEEIVSGKTREKAEQSQEEFFKEVQSGKAGLSIRAIEEAVQTLVSETPDDPNVPVKLFELKQHSSYMYQHCMECGVLGSFIATNLKYTHKDTIAFSMAMMLHDVGILTVPNDVLKKQTLLNDDEWSMIRGHCERGFEILRTVPGIDPLTLMITMGHHIYANGTGYPNAVDFNDLPLPVHMAAVINDFETLTADYRPFQKLATPHGAIQILLRNHARYHPTALEQFVRVLGVFPVATFVVLNTGEAAVVSRNNPDDLFLPEVKLVLDPAGAEYKKEIIVNLAEESDRHITGLVQDA